MASLQDLFSFISKEESARRVNEYERRIFNLGMPEHKEKVRNALIAATDSANADSAMLLYGFIIAKDKYLGAATGADGEAAARSELCRALKKYRDFHDMIIALVRLDTKLFSLDNYPTAADIRREAR